MLMPKKVKYRKQQRGRMRGKAWRGSELSFGDYGLKVLEPGRITDRQIKDEGEASPGALYSSGLIAAGGVFGLLGIIINLFQDPEIATHVPGWFGSLLRLPWRPDLFSIGPKFWPLLSPNDQTPLPTHLQSLFGVVMFVLLAASLFHFARKKLR